MNLPKIDALNVSEKRVIIRLDLDVTEGFTRVKVAKKSLQYLLENKAKIVIIGHKGRPGGKYDKELTLEPLVKVVNGLLEKEVSFVEGELDKTTIEKIKSLKDSEVLMLDNLRFNKGERENDGDFVKKLIDATNSQVYINEAFAVCHRPHASIVGLPKILPNGAGFRLFQEVKNLSHIRENPKRPLVFLISGIKKDKVGMIERIKGLADKILVAGRLPEYLGSKYDGDEDVLVAKLDESKEDITKDSINRFEKEIEEAATIVLAGVIGKYEDESRRYGTEKVFSKVAESGAYKVAGGGDTEAALTMFGLTGEFDWISVGGGAALEFLAKGSLPGIEVLLS